MLFNSLTYLLFMLIAVPLVLWGGPLVRRGVFLIGSLSFYAFWRIDFTALVLLSAGIDYLAGHAIHRTDDPRTRKRWLVVSLTMNFAILGFFKYTYFINDSFASLFSLVGLDFLPPNLRVWMMDNQPLGIASIILPLGISFYTFQSVSYTIDVYRRQQIPVEGFWLFITFVMFWPQLVAGPILRTSEVVPQLVNYERPQFREVLYGFEEILKGLFLKIVLADTIASFVDAGYGLPAEKMGTLDVWVLAFGFGLQIYFDFAGYSQIALGSARVMGFHFPRNFNWPYLAVSPRDFWKRWHISLSSWIRDYLYLPLQGVKFHKGERGLDTTAEDNSGPVRRTWALFATWFIMGLWHGANWTFAVWGLWHAALVFIYRVSEPVRERLPNPVRLVGGWLWTVPMAMLGWLYFRCQTLHDANHMVMTAFNPAKLGVRTLRENDYLIVALFFGGLLALAGLKQLAKRNVFPAPVLFVGHSLANAIMMFWVFLMLRDVQQFIYFQF